MALVIKTNGKLQLFLNVINSVLAVKGVLIWKRLVQHHHSLGEWGCCDYTAYNKTCV